MIDIFNNIFLFFFLIFNDFLLKFFSLSNKSVLLILLFSCLFIYFVIFEYHSLELISKQQLVANIMLHLTKVHPICAQLNDLKK